MSSQNFCVFGSLFGRSFEVFQKRTKRTQDTILSLFDSFFGRSFGSTILFRDLLTFSGYIFTIPWYFHKTVILPEAILNGFFNIWIPIANKHPAWLHFMTQTSFPWQLFFENWLHDKSATNGHSQAVKILKESHEPCSIAHADIRRFSIKSIFKKVGFEN